uniref:Uncharacterized protein n=1 Tax=Timema poppense TaxID=170557 RepID=A0A7R9DFQ1_TIMPO|nr:unnamed protein product [Timema poppensis]
MGSDCLDEKEREERQDDQVYQACGALQGHKVLQVSVNTATTQETIICKLLRPDLVGQPRDPD